MISPKRDRDFALNVTDGGSAVWIVEGSLAAFLKASEHAPGQTIHAQDTRRTPYRQSTDLSLEAIARALNISKGVVAKYVKLATDAGLDWPLLDDLDERRRAEELLHKLAYSDSLTQLPNRAFFNRHLAESLSEVCALGGSLALLFVDLDNFKTANDNFGYQIGDELLKQAAERLRQAVRGSDIVCHLGGDEFAVVIEDFRGACRSRVRISVDGEHPFRLNVNTDFG